jgi:hypothetical protein
MKNHILGTGALTWDKGERVGDRYGIVYLHTENSRGQRISDMSFDKEPSATLANAGARGKLIAVVKEARESTHIGDFARGVYPETPEVGETIELSTVGTFVMEDTAEGFGVGIEPDDGRNSAWMDVTSLYRAHEQTVELIFIEE